MDRIIVQNMNVVNGRYMPRISKDLGDQLAHTSVRDSGQFFALWLGLELTKRRKLGAKTGLQLKLPVRRAPLENDLRKAG